MTSQGSNSANLRLFNERVILSALRRLGQASRADLARSARLTDNTAGSIVRGLEARRYIRAKGRRLGARGQPASLFTLDPCGAHSIGIKVGRRSIDGTLVDFSGDMVLERSVDCSFPAPEDAMAIATGLVTALRHATVPGGVQRLAGVGLAIPYDLDCWQRELDMPVGLRADWRGFELPGRLEAATGLPVYMENDGTAAAVAELFNGIGRELADFLYVFIGTAVGGGVVIGGTHYRGPNGNAGDIGLMPVAPSTLSSAPRPERNFDILLARASVSSLLRHLRARGIPVASRAAVDRAISEQPVLVGEWQDDCVDALTGPLLSAARLLDVATVVIDGDLPPSVLDTLTSALAARLAASSPEARTEPRLVRGLVGRSAAALGAAILPLHLNFGPRADILTGNEIGHEPWRMSA